MFQVRFPDPAMWVEFVVGSLLSDIQFVTGRQTGEGFVKNRNDPSTFVSSRHVDDRASSSALMRMFVVSLFYNAECCYSS